MEGTIINIIGIWWLLIHIEDFIEILNHILKNKKRILLIPKYILVCPKCTMFWTALFISGNIGIAGILSILAYLFDKYLFNTDIQL